MSTDPQSTTTESIEPLVDPAEAKAISNVEETLKLIRNVTGEVGRAEKEEALKKLESFCRQARLTAQTQEALIYVMGVMDAKLFLRDDRSFGSALEISKELLRLRNLPERAARAIIVKLKEMLEGEVMEGAKTREDEEEERTKLVGLMELTDGRIDIEDIHARLALRVAAILDSQCKVEEAALALSHVHGESLTSFKLEERLDYAFRLLCLYKKIPDLPRATLLANRVCAGAAVQRALEESEKKKDINFIPHVPIPLLRRLFRLRAEIFMARDDWEEACLASWVSFSLPWDDAKSDDEFEGTAARASCLSELIVSAAIANKSSGNKQQVKSAGGVSQKRRKATITTNDISQIKETLVALPVFRKLHDEQDSKTLRLTNPLLVSFVQRGGISGSAFVPHETIDELCELELAPLAMGKARERLIESAAARNVAFILARTEQISLDMLFRMEPRATLDSLISLIGSPMSPLSGLGIDSVRGIISHLPEKDGQTLSVALAGAMDDLVERTVTIAHQLAVRKED